MEVKCQIMINKPKEDTHRAGSTVTGIVKYAVDKPTKYKNVTLSFFGRGKCHWTQQHNKTTNHYNGKEDYIVNYIDIHKKADEKITLHGEYQYPFEFFLPEDIPSSFKSYIGSITYIIELKFIKQKVFSFNKVFTTEIPVYNYVVPKSVGPVIFGLNKKLLSIFATKTPVVNLKAELNETCLKPGENAHINYKINNNTDVKIISVKAELYCYMTYTANCGKTKIVTDKIQACEVETTSIDGRSIFEYACILPTLQELYSIENSNVIKKEYRVRVTARLPMPYINASVEVLVVIGEQRGNVEAEEEGDQPPPYWVVMCEEKEELEK